MPPGEEGGARDIDTRQGGAETAMFDRCRKARFGYVESK
jgi:hypothetical protein